MTSRRRVLQLGAGLGALSGFSLKGIATEAGTDAAAAGTTDEDTLEPELAIIDPHHHLFDFPGQTAAARGIPAHYLFDQVLADMCNGHNVRASVIVGGEGFARANGPQSLKVVGDTEFANGVAAQSASGKYGPCRIGAGLVAQADLSAGSVARAVLEAHMRAGGTRFRGIRHMTVWSDDPALAPPGAMAARDLAFHSDFRHGFAELAPLGLSFDAWCYFTQLDGIADLARRFPATTIVMNHCGGPLGSAGYASRRAEAFDAWRRNVRMLGAFPNVYMKLGGLGMWTTGLASVGQSPPAQSAQIAQEQRPYLETCIEAFGVDRCMFESNYPVEAGLGSYHTIWNAFKRFAAHYSAAEKKALFSAVAAKVYRLDST